MRLKAMYSMMLEGYIIRDEEGRIATFRRSNWRGRITSGATSIISTPYKRDDCHSAGIEKMRSYIHEPSADFTIRPLGVAYRELTFEDDTFGPA